VVGSSHRQAGRTSAEHLLTRGYRRIGYVGHDIRIDLRAGKRLEGFRAAIAENGLRFVDEEFHPDGASSVEAGRTGLARLLARQPKLDAIYFSNDDLAIGGYFHCLENRISVPHDLALFGYNGLDIARLTPQPLSTIRSPRVAMGETGANLLLSGGPAKVVDLGFELIVVDIFHKKQRFDKKCVLFPQALGKNGSAVILLLAALPGSTSVQRKHK
jgi:LacI family gluconate utilization system Gnt-I transcriptional repressor